MHLISGPQYPHEPQGPQTEQSGKHDGLHVGVSIVLHTGGVQEGMHPCGKQDVGAHVGIQLGRHTGLHTGMSGMQLIAHVTLLITQTAQETSLATEATSATLTAVSTVSAAQRAKEVPSVAIAKPIEITGVINDLAPPLPPPPPPP
jgi:hypothetical protein